MSPLQQPAEQPDQPRGTARQTETERKRDRDIQALDTLEICSGYNTEVKRYPGSGYF